MSPAQTTPKDQTSALHVVLGGWTGPTPAQASTLTAARGPGHGVLNRASPSQKLAASSRDGRRAAVANSRILPLECSAADLALGTIANAMGVSTRLWTSISAGKPRRSAESRRMLLAPAVGPPLAPPLGDVPVGPGGIALGDGCPRRSPSPSQSTPAKHTRYPFSRRLPFIHRPCRSSTSTLDTLILPCCKSGPENEAKDVSTRLWTRIMVSVNKQRRSAKPWRLRLVAAVRRPLAPFLADICFSLETHRAFAAAMWRGIIYKESSGSTRRRYHCPEEAAFVDLEKHTHDSLSPRAFHTHIGPVSLCRFTIVIRTYILCLDVPPQRAIPDHSPPRNTDSPPRGACARSLPSGRPRLRGNLPDCTLHPASGSAGVASERRRPHHTGCQLRWPASESARNRKTRSAVNNDRGATTAFRRTVVVTACVDGTVLVSAFPRRPCPFGVVRLSRAEPSESFSLSCYASSFMSLPIVRAHCSPRSCSSMPSSSFARFVHVPS
uniref:Uncharacterized protein n=1 Tax=Mycena chlorophos TaxID=658473 RepID=A0ABQ0KUL4_MYCCL|nr:predicted protein [Mycena chlorophos]